MTLTDAPDPFDFDPSALFGGQHPRPGGLTDADHARIAAAHDAARTASTRTVYGYAWRQWERWCADRGLPALPGDPAAVGAYLTERAAHGITTATLDVACSAIGHQHRSHGFAGGRSASGGGPLSSLIASRTLPSGSTRSIPE